MDVALSRGERINYMLIITSKQIKEGMIIPFGYGASYHDHLRDVVVCHWLGLNWIVGAGRWLYFKILHGLVGSRWEKELHRTRVEGYRDGYAAGHNKAVDNCNRLHSKEAMLSNISEWAKEER